jgi:hypothetical protein
MATGQLRDLVRAEGPFASVYVDASHDTEDAVHQDELRFEAVLADLVAFGADEPTIIAVRDAVLGGRPPVGRAGRAVIAARGQILADDILPVPPTQPETRFSDLPYLVPLLAAVHQPVPHVVVVADKVDGWFRAVDRHGQEVPTRPVHGSDQDVHPVSGGGFAHKNIESRARETVRQNEQEIADEAARLAEQVGAAVLIVVGEVQARSALHAALPPHLQRITAELDTDAAAVDRDAVLTDADRLLAQHVAQRDAEMLDRFRAGTAHDTARQGVADVAEALRRGQVETLLVTDPVIADRTVLVGADRTQVVATPGDLPEAGTLFVERADEALPVAALATAADVLVLAGGEAGGEAVKDGVGALLRYAL